MFSSCFMLFPTFKKKYFSVKKTIETISGEGVKFCFLEKHFFLI